MLWSIDRGLKITRMDIGSYLREKKERVDSALERYCCREAQFPVSLHQAIRHSLFAGGKRIRPILCMAAFHAVGGTGEGILPFACALEMIHTYSLIHDDLPAMDNDDYRRGKPTCHKVFGEAVAILAGDALLAEAFRLMTDRVLRTSLRCGEGVIMDAIHEVAEASGISGIVGGQVVDIESEGKRVDLATLQYIHSHKTGAMIMASVKIGAALGGAEADALKAFASYGEKIGHAFQIADDLLNVEGKEELLGKRTGSDLASGKATYPSLLGVEESKRAAKELIGSGISALNSYGAEADPLREIARFIIARQH